MNSFYGVRLPSTFVSDKRWYEVNAIFGRHLFCWSLTVIAAGIAGFYQLPRHQDAYSWAAITLTLVGVATSVASTLVWMHRHPVGRDPIKAHWLVRNLEHVIPALVLALFIRAFICGAYSIPIGSEPGVAKGSHWFASKLDTGFVPGDLIAYANENGQTWIARVVTIEDTGLLLKRGSSPEEFLMPWDKIIGKMLFPYLSPGVVPAAIPASMHTPVVEGTSKAPDQKPILRGVRLQRNGKEWAQAIYSISGQTISSSPEGEDVHRLLETSSYSGMTSKNSDDCWLQLWFEHPDFDRQSSLAVEIFDVNGKALEKTFIECLRSQLGFQQTESTHAKSRR